MDVLFTQEHVILFYYLLIKKLVKCTIKISLPLLTRILSISLRNKTKTTSLSQIIPSHNLLKPPTLIQTSLLNNYLSLIRKLMICSLKQFKTIKKGVLITKRINHTLSVIAVYKTVFEIVRNLSGPGVSA